MSDTGQPAGVDGPGPNPWAKNGFVTIRCREDGPLVVELPPAAEAGQTIEVRVIDHLGGEFRPPEGKRAVALCRCGCSATKPFCDGSHRQAGFRAADLAGAAGAE